MSLVSNYKGKIYKDRLVRYIMGTCQRIIAAGLILAGLAGIVGCRNKGVQLPVKRPVQSSYFIDRGVIAPIKENPRYVKVTAADMDNDWDMDLLVSDYRKGISYFENKGRNILVDRGVIADIEEKGIYREIGVTPIDMNKDGDLDLIVTDPRTGIRYIENQGKNVFTDRGIMASFEDNYKPRGLEVTAADIDGDGDLDLFIGDSIKGIRYIENIMPQKVE